MRRIVIYSCCCLALLAIGAGRPATAQQEVFHPGETYDSLQAGQDAYGDAEAQRRALIGRQLMLEEQIQAENTWSDPQDKFRPVQPESYGPIRPRVYVGPTLADAYAYPQSGMVFYSGRSSLPPAAASNRGGAYAAPVPVFQPWPQVPGDIYGTPYYGYVRQPIGHVKIWTGRLSYIYKPIYASPAMESSLPAAPASAPVAATQRRRAEAGRAASGAPVSPGDLRVPPPPRPMLPRPGPLQAKPGAGGDLNLGMPDQSKTGQEI